nr:hypothetical protein [Tanacetum cinerariifolium]
MTGGGFGGDERVLNTSYSQGNVVSTLEDGYALCCKIAVANESMKIFADVWFFDTGATFCMTERGEWLHQYKPISKGEYVYSGNDHKLKIIGIRSIMVKMHDGTVRTIRGTLILVRGEKVAENLYQLKGEIMKEAEASIASHSLSHGVTVTWHHKLGHMSEQGMKILVERWRHKGRAKYFVSFIDDYSRRCWVYPIKKKSDTFEVFKVYKARVELYSEKKIKCLRTDNRDEYTEWSGRADEQNIVRNSKSNVGYYKLGKSFWAEVVNTACFVINRSPSTVVELKTPIEMWIEKPVNYLDLHIFGSHVYVMYNTQETTKLDPKSRKCLFLGYADGVKGYRLWDPTAHNVVVSRDSDDSFEVAPQHEVNETQAPATRTLNHERRHPGWHSDYVMESNIAYFLLTEEGEPSTLQEALNNPDASNEAMQEEIEAIHKEKNVGNSATTKRAPNRCSSIGKTQRLLSFSRGIGKECAKIVKKQSKPNKIEHETLVESKAVKRILRYIKGTSNVALCYGESGLTVKGYVDSDNVGDLDESKSTTGYVFTLYGETKKRKQHGSAMNGNGEKIDWASIESSSGRLLDTKGHLPFEIYGSLGFVALG